MTTFAPELRSHSQRVCTLYKQAMRLLEGYYVVRPIIRYRQVLLRAEFDKHKCEKDPKEMRRLVWMGEHELFMKKNPQPPAKFARSLGIAGGVAYGRVVESPDWVFDYWHPLEKAQYPQYFAKRECRKTQYIELWESGKML